MADDTTTPPIDLLDGLPEPTPDSVRAARAAAGHSQSRAAELAGLGGAYRWAEYERGARRPDAARWALYLLATGQHPTCSAKPRP